MVRLNAYIKADLAATRQSCNTCRPVGGCRLKHSRCWCQCSALLVICDYVEGRIDHSIKGIPSLVGVIEYVVASSIPLVSVRRRHKDAGYNGEPQTLSKIKITKILLAN